MSRRIRHSSLRILVMVAALVLVRCVVLVASSAMVHLHLVLFVRAGRVLVRSVVSVVADVTCLMVKWYVVGFGGVSGLSLVQVGVGTVWMMMIGVRRFVSVAIVVFLVMVVARVLSVVVRLWSAVVVRVSVVPSLAVVIVVVVHFGVLVVSVSLWWVVVVVVVLLVVAVVMVVVRGMVGGLVLVVVVVVVLCMVVGWLVLVAVALVVFAGIGPVRPGAAAPVAVAVTSSIWTPLAVAVEWPSRERVRYRRYV